jgi:hypothetical protein
MDECQGLILIEQKEVDAIFARSIANRTSRNVMRCYFHEVI